MAPEFGSHLRCLVGERLQERLELCGADVDDRAQIGARFRYVGRRKRTFQRRQQAGLAGDRGPLGPDDRQRQKIPVVAFKPRKETGAQKRRFSRAGCAEDNEEPRRRGLAQSAQPVERLDDRAVATKEDAGVLGFQRAQAAIGRSVRIALRRPSEISGVETGFFQPMLETLQSLRREGDVRFLVRDRQNGAQHHVIAPRGEAHDLPGPGKFLGQFADLQILDQHAEQPLVQVVRQMKFLESLSGEITRDCIAFST